MKMNANGGKGNHGRSRSMKKGVLKNDVFKELRRPKHYQIQINGFRTGIPIFSNSLISLSFKIVLVSLLNI